MTVAFHHMARVRAAQNKYTDELMQKNHVIGVSIGESEINPDEYVLIVLVDEILPSDYLTPEARIPSSLDGVPVVVREIGTIRIF